MEVLDLGVWDCWLVSLCVAIGVGLVVVDETDLVINRVDPVSGNEVFPNRLAPNPVVVVVALEAVVV